MLTALIPAAILGLIVFVIVSLRGRDGADLSPGGLLRLYLYLASLAGIVVFVVGVGSLVNVGFAVTAGNDFTYGRPPEMSFACPPNTPECEAARARELALNPREQMLEQRDRRRGDDLVRGLTFTVFGANQFSAGIADTLSGGIAALPIWLIYLWLVMRDVRSSATDAGT